MADRMLIEETHFSDWEDVIEGYIFYLVPESERNNRLASAKERFTVNIQPIGSPVIFPILAGYKLKAIDYGTTHELAMRKAHNYISEKASEYKKVLGLEIADNTRFAKRRESRNLENVH